MDTSERSIRLRVPASQEYLATIRLFGAASVTHFGGDPDAAEDLRLALSESSGLVMAGAGTGDGVQVTLDASEDGASIRIDVRRDGPPESAGQQGSDGNGTDRADADEDDATGLALALLRALVTNLSVDGGEGGAGLFGLSFSLALGAGVPDMPAPGGSGESPLGG